MHVYMYNVHVAGPWCRYLACLVPVREAAPLDKARMIVSFVVVTVVAEKPLHWEITRLLALSQWDTRAGLEEVHFLLSLGGEF